MEAGDVLEVADLLNRAKVRFWIDVGWGVDALVGEQTRPHLDLDLAIRTEDLGDYIRAMVAGGFRTTRIDNPYNFAMTDTGGRLVDVHLVDFAVVCATAEDRTVYGGNGLAYDVGAFGGHGWIAGREVRSCTAAFQIRSHTGYELDEQDFHDVEMLRRRFGLEIPGDYDRFLEQNANKPPTVFTGTVRGRYRDSCLSQRKLLWCLATGLRRVAVEHAPPVAYTARACEFTLGVLDHLARQICIKHCNPLSRVYCAKISTPAPVSVVSRLIASGPVAVDRSVLTITRICAMPVFSTMQTDGFPLDRSGE